ncbi:hypothetical protein EVAR_96570_1 [Eumeta japonica]|uniref:Uncharacterized protein n=1 Tax=Eumeta variegata TaxID=151549 RepID=A0A4C1WTH8_EUMVA|nr:hypothetical protein EVAR_96570_1 [Eumeta japonica]
MCLCSLWEPQRTFSPLTRASRKTEHLLSFAVSGPAQLAQVGFPSRDLSQLCAACSPPHLTQRMGRWQLWEECPSWHRRYWARGSAPCLNHDTWHIQNFLHGV